MCLMRVKERQRDYETVCIYTDNIIQLWILVGFFLIVMVITESGLVYAWGNNEYGQLGVKTKESQVSNNIQCIYMHMYMCTVNLL